MNIRLYLSKLTLTFLTWSFLTSTSFSAWAGHNDDEESEIPNAAENRTKRKTSESTQDKKTRKKRQKRSEGKEEHSVLKHPHNPPSQELITPEELIMAKELEQFLTAEPTPAPTLETQMSDFIKTPTVTLKNLIELRRNFPCKEWRKKGIGPETTLTHIARFHWATPFTYQEVRRNSTDKERYLPYGGKLWKIKLTTRHLFPEEIWTWGKKAAFDFSPENQHILFQQIAKLAIKKFNKSTWDEENWKFFLLNEEERFSLFWGFRQKFSNKALVHALHTWSNFWRQAEKTGTSIFLFLNDRFSSFSNEETYNFIEKTPLYILERMKNHFKEFKQDFFIKKIERLWQEVIQLDCDSQNSEDKERALEISPKFASLYIEKCIPSPEFKSLQFPNLNSLYIYLNKWNRSEDGSPSSLSTPVPSSPSLLSSSMSPRPSVQESRGKGRTSSGESVAKHGPTGGVTPQQTPVIPLPPRSDLTGKNEERVTFSPQENVYHSESTMRFIPWVPPAPQGNDESKEKSLKIREKFIGQLQGEQEASKKDMELLLAALTYLKDDPNNGIEYSSEWLRCLLEVEKMQEKGDQQPLPVLIQLDSFPSDEERFRHLNLMGQYVFHSNYDIIKVSDPQAFISDQELDKLKESHEWFNTHFPNNPNPRDWNRRDRIEKFKEKRKKQEEEKRQLSEGINIIIDEDTVIPSSSNQDQESKVDASEEEEVWSLVESTPSTPFLVQPSVSFPGRESTGPQVRHASAGTGLQPISIPIPVVSAAEVVSQQSYKETFPKKNREECLKFYKKFRFTRTKEIIVKHTELPASKEQITRLMEDLHLLLDHYEEPTTKLGQSFARRLKKCKKVLSQQEETQKEPIEGRKDKTRTSPESDNEVDAMAHILNVLAKRARQQNSQHKDQANQQKEESDDGELMIDDREEDDEYFPLKSRPLKIAQRIKNI